MRVEFTSVHFEDRAKAEINLAQLVTRLPQALLLPLASLLAHSPDPDGALNLLDRYAEAAPHDVLADIERHPTALTYLVAIFGYSAFLAESFLAEPALPLLFARDKRFTKLKSFEDLMQDYARFSTTNPDPWLSAQLARFKRRNYLRIVLKDVLGLSTLGETTLELSALADVVLANALAFCDQELEKRYGQPQYRDSQGRVARSGFSIASLGKLGGNELNYSSDIDLLFLYERDGETAGGTESDSIITNKEYFVRLAHAITRTITQTTPHGQVFRVDLRLRPEGEMGDLAISVTSALEYYEHRARDWELQMLIKARHSAGEARVTREFLRGVEDDIYRSPADVEAVESVLWSREKISRKLSENRDGSIDVKRHRGGIRDIEFLTQCLQRLHGKREPWVRSGGTLLALRKLNDKGCLSDRDYAALVHAYQLFRMAEHRIQFELGRQTHRLPADAPALDRLARRCGIEAQPRGLRAGEALVQKLEAAFSSVDEIYQRIIHPRAQPGDATTFELKPPMPLAADRGPQSYASLLTYLDAQSPDLAQLVRKAPVSERTRKNVVRLFSALLASSETFRAAVAGPSFVERALALAGSSEYLTELLFHHPEDILALGPSPASSEAGDQMRIRLDGVRVPAPFAWTAEPGIDVRDKMALLRREFREHIVNHGAADLTGMDSIFNCLRRWSAAAARSVASALCIAQQALSGTAHAAESAEIHLLALGLGRLGLNEFDLASDADLVFVAPSGTGREEISALVRLAEKIIQVLSSYTRDGALFAVDTRLRPRGQEGELVFTEESLLNYIAESAQTWEGATYLKAWPVAGNTAMAETVTRNLVERVLDRFQNRAGVEDELSQMRRRLEREMQAPPSNPKTAPGGYYDVDFAISYLRLRHHVLTAPGSNTDEQIAALREAGALNGQDANALSQGAAFLRSFDHAVRVVTGKAAQGLPGHTGHRDAVDQLMIRWGLLKQSENLAEQLWQVQQEVRYVYRRVLGSE
jgi:[glutamine synthetase] adenylyltransferase / [glutamine synthetase]-adenylyl-L-tyrosine phosphorylase